MLIIELFHKYFDYKDGCLYWKVKNTTWINIGDKVGWTSHGYLKAKVGNKTYYQHRIIYAMHHGYLPKYIDHIDGNRSNNKIENLRDSSKSQNGMNRSKQKNNTTGKKNVYKDNRSNKWFVKVVENGKQHYGGTFDDFFEAQLAADNLRVKVHKEFALC